MEVIYGEELPGCRAEPGIPYSSARCIIGLTGCLREELLVPSSKLDLKFQFLGIFHLLEPGGSRILVRIVARLVTFDQVGSNQEGLELQLRLLMLKNGNFCCVTCCRGPDPSGEAEFYLPMS